MPSNTNPAQSRAAHPNSKESSNSNSAPNSASASSSHTTPKQSFPELVQNLQFAWFVGHVFVLIGSLFYILSAIKFNSGSTWASFWYKTALFSVVATYGIVLFKTHRNHPNPYAIILDENFQYLIISILWIFHYPFLFYLLPYTVFSLFHFLVYARTTLLPAFGIHSSSTISHSISEFIKNYNDRFVLAVSNIELVNLIRIFFLAILFKRGSWITLIIYIGFIKVRYDNSALTKAAVRNWEVRIDSLLAHPSIPTGFRNAWISFKSSLRSYDHALNSKVKAKEAEADVKSK